MFQYIFLIIFCILSLGSGLIVLYENRRNYTSKNKKNDVCYFTETKKNQITNNNTIWQPRYISDWNIPEKLLLMKSTNNILNYSVYVTPFFNKYVSIWHHHKYHGLNLYVIRQKIIKLVKTYKKCPKEPNYLYRTNLFCKIHQYMIDMLPGKFLVNSYEEISKNAILLFLAEKYKINVRIHLILKMDMNDNLKNYYLSVVRIKKKTDLTYEDILRQKYERFRKNKRKLLVKGDRIYRKMYETKRIIKKFNTKEYECNLRFLVQNSISDISLLKSLHRYNYWKDEKGITNLFKDVIIAQNVFEDSMYLW